MLNMIKISTHLVCCAMLGTIALPISGQIASDAPTIEPIFRTLATGSDEAATAALLELGAEPHLFLTHHEEIVDAVLNATGSLNKDQLRDYFKSRYLERTPFDKIYQNRKDDRRELLVFWMADHIRTKHAKGKEEALSHSWGL